VNRAPAHRSAQRYEAAAVIVPPMYFGYLASSNYNASAFRTVWGQTKV